MPTQPRSEQIDALLENDNGGAIRMLNLLKFKAFADYGDGEGRNLSGFGAYMRYGIRRQSTQCYCQNE